MALIKPLFFFSLSLLIYTNSFSQFSGSNLIEFQIGKLPDEADNAFFSVYERGIVNYKLGKFSTSATVEIYDTKYDNRNYARLSQASVRYKHKKWDVKLGNLYETLGRGLLLRSFEINGAVIEEKGFRSRNYFHRDILGATAKYKSKKISIQALSGQVLNSEFPPTFSREDRRRSLVSALAAKVKVLKKQKFGLIYMNLDQSNRNSHYTSISLEGPLTGQLSYYIEGAFNPENTDQSALYMGVSGFAGLIGYNVEFKRYRSFVLGTGINEPPAVVQQQTYKLLNRSTHVSNPDTEDGYQVDIFYGFQNGSVLKFNHALANNELGNENRVFQEYFLEWSSYLNESISYKSFIDYAVDPLKQESKRITVGLYTDIKISEDWHILPEIELQSFDRFEADVINQSYTLGFNYKSKIFLFAQLEHTTDPFLVKENSTSRLYPGVNMRIKLNRENQILLFGGERRGGPACSAGVCYEILDFKGFECRWSTRF